VSFFSGVIKDLVTAGSTIKAGFVKLVAETDNVVLPEAEKLQPLLETVAEATVPGSSAYVDLAIKWLEDSAGVIDAGGAAVEANLANAGYDAAAIAAVKGIIPQLKAAKALASPPVQVAAPSAA
jgi:hypothetical protein